jgi:hypothetical protein
MSENLPPNPNVDTFNNSYWTTSDTDELQKEIDLLEVQVNTNTINIATNTSNIATNTSNISTLLTRTQNITATPSSTTMANSLNINFSGESLRMTGNHSYIAGYDLSAGTRDYYIGTPGAGVKSLNIVNEKQDINLNVPGTRAVYANTNALYVGSTTTANPNSFYSNIFMRDPFNLNWETQSRAFTETLRASVFTSNAAVTNWNTIFQLPIIRITTSTGNVDIIGRSTTLTPSFNYPTASPLFDLGLLMYNNGYTSFFNSSGQWIYNGLLTQRVSVQYDVTFNSLNTGIKAFVCRILTSSPAGNSRPQGVRYNQTGGNPLNTTLYVSTGQFIFDIEALNTVKLETENFFSTSSDGASVTTNGRLTFYLLPY